MPAIAQQQGPASSTTDTPELQEIIVTGSDGSTRVNAETAEAITILKSDDLKRSGASRMWS